MVLLTGHRVHYHRTPGVFFDGTPPKYLILPPSPPQYLYYTIGHFQESLSALSAFAFCSNFFFPSPMMQRNSPKKCIFWDFFASPLQLVWRKKGKVKDGGGGREERSLKGGGRSLKVGVFSRRIIRDDKKLWRSLTAFLASFLQGFWRRRPCPASPPCHLPQSRPSSSLSHRCPPYFPADNGDQSTIVFSEAFDFKKLLITVRKDEKNCAGK